MRYGEAIDSSCQQFISDLSDAGASFLNPSTYLYAGWGVAPGTRPALKRPAAIKVNSVWLLKSSDGTMTKTYDSSVATPSSTYLQGVTPVYTSTASGCTLTNGAKEVFYNIESL